LEFWRWIAVGLQRSPGLCDAESKSLHKPQRLEDASQGLVAVVANARLAEVLFGDSAEGATWAVNLDAVVKPIDANRRVST
jgi:hypothetical protein